MTLSISCRFRQKLGLLQITMRIINVVNEIHEGIVAEVIQRKGSLHQEKKRICIYARNQGSAIVTQLVRQDGHLSGASQRQISKQPCKVTEAQKIVNDSLATQSLKMHSIKSKANKSINMLPNKIPKPLFNQSTHFSNLVRTLKSNREISKVQKEKELIKLTLDRPDQQLSSTQRQKLLRQKEIKLNPHSPQESASKKKMALALNNHLKKGRSFKFTFDQQGQLLLFRSHQLTPSFVSPSSYHINVGPETSKHCGNHPYYPENDQKIDSTPMTPIFTKGRIQSERDKKQGPMLNAIPKMIKSLSTSTALISSSQPSSRYCVSTQDVTQKNKFYNNNGQRQTTSCPFFKAQKGINYQQIDTRTGLKLFNQFKKCQGNPSSRKRSALSYTFKSHLDLKGSNIIDKQIKQIDNSSQMAKINQGQSSVVVQKQALTSRTRASDRIKTQNLRLFQTLII